jgi:hypothetical protein
MFRFLFNVGRVEDHVGWSVGVLWLALGRRTTRASG